MKGSFDIWKYLTPILCAVIIVLGVWRIYPLYQQNQSLLAEGAKKDRQIAEMNEKIRKVKDNQRRLRSDPDFVEHIARQRNLVFPGETVFVFDSKR